VFGEKSRNLVWDLKISVCWAYIIRFSWKLEDEESGVKSNKGHFFGHPTG
jgi:hypothetical protein